MIVCFALGLMSKPMLVTLPCVMLLLDYWPIGKTSDSRRAFESPCGSVYCEKTPAVRIGDRLDAG